jgi:hypothetical protein
MRLIAARLIAARHPSHRGHTYTHKGFMIVVD